MQITLWAEDANEKLEILSKPWNVNIDLEVSVKVCDADGLPGDVNICYGSKVIN